MNNVRDPEPAVLIERTLDAPIVLVWQMWTDPQHFAAWYGPDGATVSIAEMDVRIGGTRFIGMHVTTPDGPMSMWFTGTYLEIAEHTRLVYSESLCDESGETIDPSDLGMPPGHPRTTEVRIELHDLGSRTKMIMTHVGIPADSPGAVGWGMAFDKLATYLGALG